MSTNEIAFIRSLIKTSSLHSNNQISINDMSKYEKLEVKLLVFIKQLVNEITYVSKLSKCTSATVTITNCVLKRNGIQTLKCYDPTEIIIKSTFNKEISKIHEPNLSVHWLSFLWIQPQIRENPTNQFIDLQKQYLHNITNMEGQNRLKPDKPKKLMPRHDREGNPKIADDIHLGYMKSNMEVKPATVHPHFIGIQHKIFFDTITKDAMGESEEKRRQAFKHLSNELSVHQLIPHFSVFICEGIRLCLLHASRDTSLHNSHSNTLSRLSYLIRMTRAFAYNSQSTLAQNSSSSTQDPNHLSTYYYNSYDNSAAYARNCHTSSSLSNNEYHGVLYWYLHRIVPSLLSIVLCGSISPLKSTIDTQSQTENYENVIVDQFEIRRYAGRTIKELCDRYIGVRHESLTKYVAAILTGHLSSLLKQSSECLSAQNRDKISQVFSISGVPKIKKVNANDRPLLRLNSLFGTLICMIEMGGIVIEHCLMVYVSPICLFITDLESISGRNETEDPDNLWHLTNVEKLTVALIKKILLMEWIVVPLYHYHQRVHKEAIDINTCIEQYGYELGIAFNGFFNRLHEANTRNGDNSK